MDCTQSPLAQQALPRPQRAAMQDVTVIGAGPAGALLAYLLAVRGLRVALVEKARLPRIKPCGGGLNHKTLELLPFPIESVVERAVSRLIFTQNLRHPFLRTSPEPLVSMVTRCAFDHFLVQRAADAGVQVYDACRVTRVEEAPRCLTLRSRPRYWQALAKILRGERGFADVNRVLRRHPYLVRGVLWLRANRQGIGFTETSAK